jgi:hypothetical protein
MTRRDWAMEVIGRVDPALIEEADSVVLRWRFRPVRAAMVAACISFLFVMTAFAVQQFGSFRALERAIIRLDGQHYEDYTLWGGAEFVAVESLSEELLQLSQDNPGTTIPISPITRKKLEEMTGQDLLEKLDMDDLISESFKAALSSDQEGPTVIEFSDNYRGKKMPSLSVRVLGTLYTEQMDVPGHEPSMGYYFRPGSDYRVEEYTTAQGWEVYRFRYVIPEGEPLSDYFSEDLYRACFSMNGIRWTVEVYCPDDPQYAGVIMDEVLDNLRFE